MGMNTASPPIASSPPLGIESCAGTGWYPFEMPNSPGQPSCPSCKSLRDELLGLNEFTEIVGSQSNLNELYWTMSDTIASILGVKDLVLYLREGEMLIQKSAYGIKKSDRKIFEPIEIPIGSGIVGTAATTGLSQRVDDTSKFPGYIPDQFKGQSELAVPVLFENRVIGVFDTESKNKNGYTKKDCQILERLARIAGPRIQTIIQKEKLEEAVVFLMDEREQTLKNNMRKSGNVPFPGQEIGLFRLERMLNLGKTSTLWEATQQDLGRPVILQVLHQNKGETEKSIRFIQKAKVASQLQHPNIAEVYDCGEDESWFWISLEHLPSPQLLSVFADSMSRLPSLPEHYYSAIAWTLKRVAGALHYAHSRNVVHGQISTRNLILNPKEEPQVIGFGEATSTDLVNKKITDVVDFSKSAYQAITFRPFQEEGDFIPPNLIRPECPDFLNSFCEKTLNCLDRSQLSMEFILELLAKPEKSDSSDHESSILRNLLRRLSGNR